MTSGIGIGIDLGGTLIKAAAFDLASGKNLARRTTATRDGEFEPGGTPRFATGVAALLAELAAEHGAPAAVGLSAPGLADAGQTRIDFMPNKMHGIEGFDWRGHLGLASDVAFAVLNDAHAALMGEIWLGAARDRRDVVLLTLGTGVGGAIVSGGRLVTGRIGRAGHLGHLSLDPDGPPDICGTPGSIEDAIGNHSVAHRSDGRFLSTHDLIRALEAGDSVAASVWHRSIRALGATVVGLINALDPETVVIGGGISRAGRLLFDPLEEYLDRHEWRPGGHRVPVVAAELGEWAGACGVVRFAVRRSSESASLTTP